jgi:hypothetical protein
LTYILQKLKANCQEKRASAGQDALGHLSSGRLEQGDCKAAAGVVGVFDDDGAVIVLDNAVADGQAQAEEICAWLK